MSFFKNMLSGRGIRDPVPDDKPNEKAKDTDMQVTDLFDGGHKLTALENIGSSLTTLWSSCDLNIRSSRANIALQSYLNSNPKSDSEISEASKEDLGSGPTTLTF